MKPLKVKLIYRQDTSLSKEEAEGKMADAYKILFDEVLRRRKEEQARKEGS